MARSAPALAESKPQPKLLPRVRPQTAEMIGQPVQAVSENLDAKTGITAETAVSISEALGTSAQLWLNLETMYRRHQRRLAADLGAHDRGSLATTTGGVHLSGSNTPMAC